MWALHSICVMFAVYGLVQVQVAAEYFSDYSSFNPVISDVRYLDRNNEPMCETGGIPVCGTNGFENILFENECRLDAYNMRTYFSDHLELEKTLLSNCYDTCELACPRIYSPVCVAPTATQVPETISNQCELSRRICLSNEDWTFIKTGECDDPLIDPIPSTEKPPCPSVCTMENAPICATLNNNQRTFTSTCALRQRNCRTNEAWKLKHNGPCASTSFRLPLPYPFYYAPQYNNHRTYNNYWGHGTQTSNVQTQIGSGATSAGVSVAGSGRGPYRGNHGPSPYEPVPYGPLPYGSIPYGLSSYGPAVSNSKHYYPPGNAPIRQYPGHRRRPTSTSVPNCPPIATTSTTTTTTTETPITTTTTTETPITTTTTETPITTTTTTETPITTTTTEESTTTPEESTTTTEESTTTSEESTTTTEESTTTTEESTSTTEESTSTTEESTTTTEESTTTTEESTTTTEEPTTTTEEYTTTTEESTTTTEEPTTTTTDEPTTTTEEYTTTTEEYTTTTEESTTTTEESTTTTEEYTTTTEESTTTTEESTTTTEESTTSEEPTTTTEEYTTTTEESTTTTEEPTTTTEEYTTATEEPTTTTEEYTTTTEESTTTTEESTTTTEESTTSEEPSTATTTTEQPTTSTSPKPTTPTPPGEVSTTTTIAPGTTPCGPLFPKTTRNHQYSGWSHGWLPSQGFPNVYNQYGGNAYIYPITTNSRPKPTNVYDQPIHTWPIHGAPNYPNVFYPGPMSQTILSPVPNYPNYPYSPYWNPFPGSQMPLQPSRPSNTGTMDTYVRSMVKSIMHGNKQPYSQ